MSHPRSTALHAPESVADTETSERGERCRKHETSEGAFSQLRTKVFFCFCTFLTNICEILTFGNDLKLKIIDYIFRKIITLNEVNILETDIIKKKSRKIDKKKPLSCFGLSF